MCCAAFFNRMIAAAGAGADAYSGYSGYKMKEKGYTVQNPITRKKIRSQHRINCFLLFGEFSKLSNLFSFFFLRSGLSGIFFLCVAEAFDDEQGSTDENR